MRYDSRLDTLRGLAAISVLGFHYSARFGWGWLGVPLFFVLSGYLINSILLESKARAEHFGDFLREFYFKRVLRLVPLYALFVALCVVLEFSRHHGARILADLPALLTYTFNFTELDHLSRDYGHLWSLSVEWQFYLVWPIAAWMLPPRALQRLLVGLVCLAPVLRFLSVHWLARHGESYSLAAVSAYLLTWTHLDLLALGAILAWRSPRRWLGSRRFLLGLTAGVFGAGLAVTLLGWRHGYWGNHSAWSAFRCELESFGFPIGLARFREYIWGYSLVGLLFASVVAAIASTSTVVGIFRWRWLRHLGRVSYGFYVFHALAILVARQLAPALPWRAGLVWSPLSSLLTLVAAGAIAFVCAHLSFQFWETRFLNLSARLRRSSSRESVPIAPSFPPSVGLG